MSLLPDFTNIDTREVIPFGTFKLVPALEERKHPMWVFNNAVTLTLWARKDPVQDNILLVLW